MFLDRIVRRLDPGICSYLPGPECLKGRILEFILYVPGPG
jgi:hypothetical protein